MLGGKGLEPQSDTGLPSEQFPLHNVLLRAWKAPSLPHTFLIYLRTLGFQWREETPPLLLSKKL